MWQQCWNERVLLQRIQAWITRQPSGVQMWKGGHSFESKVFVLFSFHLPGRWGKIRLDAAHLHPATWLFTQSSSFFFFSPPFSTNKLLEENLDRDDVFRCLWRCKNSKWNLQWHKHQISAQEKSKAFFEYISLPRNWNASTAVCFLCTEHLTSDCGAAHT